jgi:hypothetical protein
VIQPASASRTCGKECEDGGRRINHCFPIAPFYPKYLPRIAMSETEGLLEMKDIQFHHKINN